MLVIGTFLLFFFTLLYNCNMMPDSTSSNRTDDSMMMRHMTSNAANDGTLETTCLDRSDCRYSENENRCAATTSPGSHLLEPSLNCVLMRYAIHPPFGVDL